MQKKYRIVLSIIFVLIIIFSLFLAAYSFLPKKEEEVFKEIDEIANYNYALKDRDTALMKEVFNKLKDTLKEEEINYEEYSEYLSELFIIDLFTLDNKAYKYDIGGSDYILDEIRENYELNVTDTLYKYLENKDKRKDKYPVVKKVECIEKKATKYTYAEVEYDAYDVSLKWEYEKDLGYIDEGVVTLIKKDDKLYVVGFKGVE